VRGLLLSFPALNTAFLFVLIKPFKLFARLKLLVLIIAQSSSSVNAYAFAVGLPKITFITSIRKGHKKGGCFSAPRPFLIRPAVRLQLSLVRVSMPDLR
jgi:hypothetical protein